MRKHQDSTLLFSGCEAQHTVCPEGSSKIWLVWYASLLKKPHVQFCRSLCLSWFSWYENPLRSGGYFWACSSPFDRFPASGSSFTAQRILNSAFNCSWTIRLSCSYPQLLPALCKVEFGLNSKVHICLQCCSARLHCGTLWVSQKSLTCTQKFI